MATAAGACGIMGSVVVSVSRWKIIEWFNKHWKDVQWVSGCAFLLKLWMLIWELTICLCLSNRPEVEITIPLSATSVPERPHRLGNMIIQLSRCSSFCFSVNSWRAIHFPGKMGLTYNCLFQEINFNFELGKIYQWCLISCSSKLVVILFLKLIIWVCISVFGDG